MFDASFTTVVDDDGGRGGVLIVATAPHPVAPAAERPRRSGDELATVIEHLPLAVGVLSPSGAFRLANTAMRKLRARLSAYGLADPRSARITDAAGRTLEPAAWPGARALRGHRVEPGTELCHEDQHGRKRWLSVSAVPLLHDDAPRDEHEALVIARDITEERAAAAARAQQHDLIETVLETLPVGVVVADAAGRIIRDNPAARELWGGRLTAESWDDYGGIVGYWPETGERIRPEEWAMTRALVHGETTRGELIRNERFGTREQRYYLNNVSPLRGRDGRIIGGVAAMLDVSERLEAERALERAKITLEERVAERTAALEDQAHRLQTLTRELAAAEQRERKRLAALLHDDLQQYLVALKMRLTSRGGGARDPLLDQAVALTDEAIAASRNLTRELRPPMLYEAGLAPALRWLAGDMAQRHGLRVALHAADDFGPRNEDLRAMLYECVRELLLNVVKHAGVDEVEVRCVQERDHLVIHVRDRGRGVATSDAVADGGTGLGLFSIRERLQAVGGDLIIRSSPEEGTEVTVVVPRAPGSAADRVDPGPRSPSSAPREIEAPVDAVRLLVVDDHAVVRRGLVALVEEDPRIFVVGRAADGIEALEAVTTAAPTVVLMDVNMPRMNGIEATRAIVERWPGVRVIGASAHDDPATDEAMRRAGARDFVSKDADTETLVAAILRAGGKDAA